MDERLWHEALTKPDWYLYIGDNFKHLSELAKHETDYDKRKQIKEPVYAAVEAAVKNKTLPLAEQGENLDRERQPIDMIVIHHTANRPGMTLERLNAMHLLRIYGSYYANPTKSGEEHFKGKPVWSGHFYNGQQVFWGYHWFIRQDGTVEHILEDKYIGWQAGKWDVNIRSVGICIDDDLTHKEPNETILKSIATIISQHYSTVPKAKIVGHLDVNPKTECPGDKFQTSWQPKLLAKLA